ncbi:TPA: hypothetical protein DD712_00510 [Candidatus Acetothermia bacterium]|nr:hypothetical protein [Candidatus Acetothermia bacterium]
MNSLGFSQSIHDQADHREVKSQVVSNFLKFAMLATDGHVNAFVSSLLVRHIGEQLFKIRPGCVALSAEDVLVGRRIQQ